MTTWRLVGEGINTCLICGCFRGGGDSRFGMIVDPYLCGLLQFRQLSLQHMFFKLPPVWVYFVMTLDEFEKNASGIYSLFQKEMAYKYYQRF